MFNYENKKKQSLNIDFIVNNNTLKRSKVYIILHRHNLFLFKCDAIRSLNRHEARCKLFIDQGRTPVYRLLRYFGQYRCNAVFT